MKSFILKSIVLLFTISIQVSCVDGDENECYFEIQSFATAVTGPTTVNVNEPITFEVVYSPLYGCTSFLKFDQEIQDNVYYLRVMSKGDACSCPDDPLPASVTYSVTITTPGEYTFRFKSDVDSAIIKNVTVQ